MKIVVYSTPNCVQCRFTKNELNRLHLIFEDIDVSQDRAAASDARRIGHENGWHSFPVVVVSFANGQGQQCWSGFSVEKIRGLAASNDNRRAQHPEYGGLLGLSDPALAPAGRPNLSTVCPCQDRVPLCGGPRVHCPVHDPVVAEGDWDA